MQERLRISKHTKDKASRNYSISDLTNVVLDYFLPNSYLERLVEAANRNVSSGNEVVDVDDVKHFIRVICWLSYYQCPTSKFFDPVESEDHPASRNFSHQRFKKVMKGLAGRKDPGNVWGHPFGEDIDIRMIENLMAQISAPLAFIAGETILSVDDDQYRLSSRRVESQLGLTRIKNPRKAFGPVSTGAVSLNTGITFATRLKGREESTLENLEMVMQMTFGENHCSRVKAKGTICGLDRGYLIQPVINWLSKAGFKAMGTTPRGKGFPFTFGTNTYQNTISILENGAKCTYWARRGQEMVLGYRQGNGNVATLYCGNPTMIERARFYYVPNRTPKPSLITSDVYGEMLHVHKEQSYVSLTARQGGLDWHILRSGLGLITGTVAAHVLQ
ncbi:MAG: hypothetical protein ACRDL7_02955 [Gaiellaceae bacterium]